jgi:hypothetical protein
MKEYIMGIITGASLMVCAFVFMGQTPVDMENDFEYIGTYGSSNAMMVLNRKTGVMLTRFVSDMPNDNNAFHEIDWANQTERWVAK